MKNVGGGSDGVASEEERTARLLGGHYQSPCSGGVAVDVGIVSRTNVLRLDAVGRHRGVYVGPVVVAGLDYLGIGLVNGGLAGKLILKMMHGSLQRTVKQPAHEAESKYVAALQHRLVVKSRFGKCGLGHRGDGHLNHLCVKVKFLEGVGCFKKSLFQVGFLE